MPEKQLSKKKNQSENMEIYIGSNDLNRDSEQIRSMIQDPNVDGVLLNVRMKKSGNYPIYRKNTPHQTEENVVKTIRRYLAVISVFGGEASLMAVKDGRNMSDRAVDFNNFYETLVQKSWILDRE